MEKGVIVLGNIIDKTNKTYAGYRVYYGGGTCPCVCASGFKRDIYVVKMYEAKTDQSGWKDG